MRESIPTLNTTLTTPALYVLLALTDKTLHGYGIRSQVADDSEGQVILAMGTVYPLLDRLVKQRLIERIEASNTRRNVACRYRITGWGRKELAREVRRLERMAVQMRYKLTGRI